MAWTTPKTDWTTGELVTAEDMNTIGENLAALKDPPTAAYTTTEEIIAQVDELSDVDSENMNLQITTTGGDVLVHFHGLMNRRGTSYGFTATVNVEVDGNLLGGASGIWRSNIGDRQIDVGFTHLIQNLSAGSHVFKLQWKRTGQSHFKAVLSPGAHFWVREI